MVTLKSGVRLFCEWVKLCISIIDVLRFLLTYSDTTHLRLIIWLDIGLTISCNRLHQYFPSLLDSFVYVYNYYERETIHVEVPRNTGYGLKLCPLPLSCTSSTVDLVFEYQKVWSKCDSIDIV